jgi:hypothetical protein
MLPHRIRLRGPWELTPLKRADGSEANLPPLTAHMPVLWHECGLAGFAGRVRHTRRFGAPRKLDSFERVWLTFGGISGRSEIWLNDERLGAWPAGSSPFEMEITEKLRDRNELRVEIEADESGGMPGESALEIRGQAWLADLLVEMTGERIRIRGAVRGQAEGPLDLYAIWGRATVIQARVEASTAGQPFDLVSDSIPARDASGAVTIELVSGSSVWHSVEVPLTGR